ncbi:MAG: acyl-CoA reductase [Lachnospiraceae bacterium]|nr:acyl-CoA reductase [Lachnospiraceae bacterium]
MILFKGCLFPDEKMDDILAQLWDFCIHSIENRADISEKVIAACGQIADKIRSGAYDDILEPLLRKGTFSMQQMEEAIAYFDKENLTIKYQTQLGVLKQYCSEERRLEPLGILFHIAAGNAEGLPFYSVLEGMLAGNINILKLPSMDDGLSVMLLYEMIQIEPVLADYVCVLDVPSSNLKVMKQLADMADAIVVWGGDEAVLAARAMADACTQIISWGHKLSFAYVTPQMFESTDECGGREELYALARHICETRQVLCSSCQGIFVDTDDMKIIWEAGETFVKILEEVSAEFPQETIGIRGKMTISLYNEELEAKKSGRKIFRQKGVSVIASSDHELELSYMFKNCYIKPLPRRELVRALKGKKGYLQTVGLICAREERKELVELLTKTGVTRIAHGGNMSHTASDSAHDGEYPLRRYCKVVEVE